MSRIAKQPITIPEKTSVKVDAGVLVVEGPLGRLTRAVSPYVALEVREGAVAVTPVGGSKEARMLWGTYAAHLRNMLSGVNKPFATKLIIEGIGYKADASGDTVTLNLGLSHPVKVKIPTGLTVKTEKGTITVTGINKEEVGQFAANLRKLKVPEPYKGKGIRYEGEVVRRKEGKKTVS